MDLVFVYGTLMPGDVAWRRIAPYVVGAPVSGTLRGTLYDTGLGYPALVEDPADDVPGWTLRLRSPSAALAELDEYEGDEYRRIRVVDSGGRACWTYVWTAPMTGLVRLAGGWRPAVAGQTDRMWLAIVLGEFPDVPDAVVVRYAVPAEVADFEPVVDDVAAAVDKAVADHPGLPVVLVGEGIGGMVAVRYTQRYPQPVDALVLVTPVLGPWAALDQLSEPDVTGPWTRQTLAAIEECLSTIDFDHPLGDDLPALWLHGDDDAVVPVSDTRAGMDRIRGLRFEERIRPGLLDHATSVADVTAFLAQLPADGSSGTGSS